MSDEEGYVKSEDGNWNVAGDFARLKIMKRLYLADEYADIATYGTSGMIEEIQMPPGIQVDHLRMRGLDRLINELITIIDNAWFAMKKSTEKESLMAFREELIRYRNVMGALCEVVTNHRTKVQTVRIIASKFDPALERIKAIKREMNAPLNKNNLIFTHREEFDPKAYKDQIKQEAMTKG